jgi:hypothetical protein
MSAKSLLNAIFPLDTIPGRIDDARVERREKKEKEAFARFVVDNNVTKSTSSADEIREGFENLRCAREIGPQLQDYLLNYGHLKFGTMRLCGIGKDIEDTLDMTVRTKEFRKVGDIDDERIVMVLEIIDENVFAVIDRRFDAVAYYNVSERRFSNCDKTNKKIGYDFKLYDYIKMRVEEEREKMCAEKREE